MTPDQIISVLSYWPACLYLAAWFTMAGTVVLVSLLAFIGVFLAIVRKLLNLYSDSRVHGRKKVNYEVVSN